MKPTYLERLESFFNPKMKEILNDPCRIALIDNPSERLQLAAVRASSSALMFIDNPSPKVQSMAVVGNPIYIKFIKEPAETAKRLIVAMNPCNISLIDNPSISLQMSAVRNYPDSIKLISNPCHEAVNMYIKGDYTKLAEIENVPIEVQKDAIDSNPDNARYIRNLDNSLKSVQYSSVHSSNNISPEIKNVSETSSFIQSYSSAENSYREKVKDIENQNIPDSEKLAEIQEAENIRKEGKIKAVQELSNNLGLNIDCKHLFNEIENKSSISSNEIKASEWMQLIKDGRCKIDNKVLEINLNGDDILSVVETTTIHPPVKDKPVIAEEFIPDKETIVGNISDKQIKNNKIADNLEDKFRNIPRKIDFKSLVKSLEDTGIKAEDLKFENWHELIKKGSTTYNGHTLKMTKSPMGYKISMVSAPAKVASAIKKVSDNLNEQSRCEM